MRAPSSRRRWFTSPICGSPIRLSYSCENRAHFYAVAANTMRRVLIEHARKRKAQKRGAGVKITLKTGMDLAQERAPDFIALDDALRRLAELDERKSRAIELKFFGGLDDGRNRSSSGNFSGDGGTRASPRASMAAPRNVAQLRHERARMTIDRWNLIEEIFQGALERPPSERKEYLRGACGERRGSALRGRVTTGKR